MPHTSAFSQRFTLADIANISVFYIQHCFIHQKGPYLFLKSLNNKVVYHIFSQYGGLPILERVNGCYRTLFPHFTVLKNPLACEKYDGTSRIPYDHVTSCGVVKI